MVAFDHTTDAYVTQFLLRGVLIEEQHVAA